jgi:hypothetical protein
MRIMDGKIWKTIAGCDGKPFFDNRPDQEHSDELRIGVTLGFDGYNLGYSLPVRFLQFYSSFGFKSRQAGSGGSHSSGVLSNCIANLPNHLK